MANSENLIPQNQRTKSEQRAIARAGGIASGESRRKRKTLRQALQSILASEVEPGKTGVEVLAVSLFNAAKDGDLKALEKIHNLTDERRDRRQQIDEYDDLYKPVNAMDFGLNKCDYKEYDY